MDRMPAARKSSEQVAEKAIDAIAKKEGEYAGALIRAEQRFRQKEAKAAIELERSRTEQLVDDFKARLKEWSNERSMRIAGAAAGGFGLGAAIAYFGDGFVVQKFGTGTFSLILIPGIGLLAAGAAPFIKDKGQKSHAETRAGVFGMGLGLALMGGYMSWQRWK